MTSKTKMILKRVLKNPKRINNTTKGILVVKTFKEIREAKKVLDSGKLVFNKKIKKIPAQIYNTEKGNTPFVAYVDGDKLDAFRSQKEAEKAIETIIKELT